MNATKTQYTVGIYLYGIKNESQDCYYNLLTTPPKIIAVARDEEQAREWIAREMARQEREIRLLPGQGEHRLYETISLQDEAAYQSRQDVGRFSINIPMRKAALVNSTEVVKV